LRRSVFGIQSKISVQELARSTIGTHRPLKGLPNCMARKREPERNGASTGKRAGRLMSLGDYSDSPRRYRERTGRPLSVPVGEELLGRVVTHRPAHRTARPDQYEDLRPLIARAERHRTRARKQPLRPASRPSTRMIPSVAAARTDHRRPPDRQDCRLPRYDHQSKRRDVVVFVGNRPEKVTCQRRRTLEKYGALDYTIVVSATLATPRRCSSSPRIRLRDGRIFRDLVARPHHYDDLFQDTPSVRRFPVASRPPGREASRARHLQPAQPVVGTRTRNSYRRAEFNPVYPKGGGSLTALPIIETQEGDYSAYIPTNVISITDGQIYSSPTVYAGIVRRSSVFSVSRVGTSAQPAMRSIAGPCA